MSWTLLLLGLILFVCLIIVHEYGHLIAARRSNVDVEEFGLGFPPRALVLTKKKGTVYSLNWIPFGGFVRLKGEHDADKTRGGFGATRLRNKVKIMLAGVTMNLLVAFLLFTLVAAMGMPQLVDNQFKIARDSHISQNQVIIVNVESGSPAQSAGIHDQDRLESIGPVGGFQKAVTTSDNIPELTKQFAGQEVKVIYQHAGMQRVAEIRLRTASEVQESKNSTNPKGYLGVVPSDYQIRKATWSAPVVAIGTMWQLTVLTFQGLWHVVTDLSTGHPGQASQQVAGPVGVFEILKQGTALGVWFVLMLIGYISLTLAIMNTLPIPGLDGGRLFVTLLYRLRHKVLNEETEDRIQGTGLAILFAILILVTVLDIQRIL